MRNAIKRFWKSINNTPATRLESRARLQVSVRSVYSKSVEWPLQLLYHITIQLPADGE